MRSSQLAARDASDGPDAARSTHGIVLLVAYGNDPLREPAVIRKTDSGLGYEVLTRGTGTKHPRRWDRVSVHYTGWTADGEVIDSSRARGRPATFVLDKALPGWTEGVQLMVVGDAYRFFVPEPLAYGGRPDKPRGTLVFDIELVAFDELPEPRSPPQAPEHVAAPPARAKTTPSGLSYEVLTEGTGTEHPTATSMVMLHYTGWTADGEMFGSTIPRGKPSTFPLDGVIPGWAPRA